uniref:Uncharacterized protein n=1 Tax=Picea glauca TaxID=3330 RepID=A0A101LV20_PICGL|nr:hypothetical protein ABT39_MTgene2219 [Picea glauca]
MQKSRVCGRSSRSSCSLPGIAPCLFMSSSSCIAFCQQFTEVVYLAQSLACSEPVLSDPVPCGRIFRFCTLC